MGDIFMCAANDFARTDETGAAKIKTKIPGTFTSVDGFQEPAPDGRFFKSAHVWAENGVPGDLIKNIRVEDVDGILSQMAVLFPKYPVIQPLSDEDVSGSASGGLVLPVGEVITLQAVDPRDNRGFKFIPAQLYICCDFVAGIVAADRVVRVNYIWGKYFSAPAVAQAQSQQQQVVGGPV